MFLLWKPCDYCWGMYIHKYNMLYFILINSTHIDRKGNEKTINYLILKVLKNFF